MPQASSRARVRASEPPLNPISAFPQGEAAPKGGFAATENV